MPNGILQGSFGDILNKVRMGGTTQDALEAIERIVLLLSNPLVLNQQLQITWNGAAGPAILITAANNATPQAVGIQIGQGGQIAILGVGQQSIGIHANALNNRDVFQAQTNSVIAQLTAAAPGSKPFSNVATGFNTTGIATGRLSSDVGTMTAGPGETMPNATISGYKKVSQNNFIAEGFLTTPLAAASSFTTGATTATLQTAIVDPAGSGNLVNGATLTLTNRNTQLSAEPGSFVQAMWSNGEWRPFAVTPAPTTTGGCQYATAVPINLTIAGIAGLSQTSTHPCTGCSAYAQTQTLTWSGDFSGACTWETAATISCSGIGTKPLYLLVYASPPNASINMGGFATYNCSSFAPLSANTFTLAASPSGWGCGTLPSSITVSPVT